jgi:hypothetical protein
METSKQRKLRRLIETLKLHQQLLNTQAEIENYLKENNTSNCKLMTELLECICKIDDSKQSLLEEAARNGSWDELWMDCE